MEEPDREMNESSAHHRNRHFCKLGIDATKKIPGEGLKRPGPPLIKMDAAVKAKVEKLLGK
jgi:3-polyprenyl-4-hydroxybenzoate decarboxylase